MLAFFRKYQKIFFSFITVIIVISFAFFGSYQAFLPSRSWGSEEAFKTLDGAKVSQKRLALMTHFLVAGGEGGIGNIFNDGVIEKDFLESKLATRLALAFQERFINDFALRFAREKGYKPYVHEKSPSLCAKAAWDLYAPKVNTNLATLQEAKDPFSKEALDAKGALYLAQTTFPPFLLKRALMMSLQDKGLAPDSRLERDSLTLFGYKNLKEWYGDTFVSTIAQVVLNGAALAKKQGYTVSTQEVVADLTERTHQAYQKMQGYFENKVAGPSDLYRQCLNALGFQEADLIDLWTHVLLFRRLFNDVGGSVVMDTLAQREFFEYANETATIKVTKVPKALHFATKEQWHKFEVYLEGVSDYPQKGHELPTALLTANEVQKKCPKLAQRHFECEVAHVKKSAVAGIISVKQTWEWEVLENNFEMLKGQFFELGLETVTTPEERFALLQKLSSKRRAEVDAYARACIVDADPSLVKEAVQAAPFKPKRITVGANATLLEGIADSEAFVALLENDPEGELSYYTQDRAHFYSIKVKEASPYEVLSFEEANERGILEDLLHQKLYNHFLTIRESMPHWKREGGGYLPLRQVKDEVADLLWAPLYRSLYNALVEHRVLEKGIKLAKLGERLAPLRFALILSKNLEVSPTLPWAFVTEELSITRAHSNLLSLQEAKALEGQEKAELKIDPVSGPFLATFIESKHDKTVALDTLLALQAPLKEEAQSHLFDKLLQEIKTHAALVELEP